MPLIDFSIGDPVEPTAPAIPEALRKAVPTVSNYPTTRGLPALRQAIAGYVERRFGVVVDPLTQVLPTSGSKEAIFSSHLAFVDRSTASRVVYPTPGYPIYHRGAVFAGATPHPVKLEGDFVFRPQQVVADVWEDAAMVWICSPHNPAGSVTAIESLHGFVERGLEHGTLVCADECYIDLYDGAPPPSILQVSRSEGVLSFFSLSKRSGMTGYRSGAIVGDPVAIAALATLRTSTGTASPEFTQAAAIVAWSDDAHVAERRSVFAEKRRVLRAAFEAAGLKVVGSAAGLYLWVEVGDDLDATERLLDHHVVVSPGRAFGPGGEGYIRLAMVPTVEECAEAAKVVTECLKN
jgi:succinyldiaminopimelate transaminase